MLDVVERNATKRSERSERSTASHPIPQFAGRLSTTFNADGSFCMIYHEIAANYVTFFEILRPVTADLRHLPYTADIAMDAVKSLDYGRASPVVFSNSEIAARVEETLPFGNVSWRTLFTSSQTPTDSLTTGIALCPPKTGHLCAHRHSQAEVYYIIEGQGTVKIDSKETDVQAGSVVFIPGNAEHAIWNVGDEPLRWFYVFPTDAFEDVIYRFS